MSEIRSPSRECQPVPGPLAIICGGGSLPYAVADAVAARGRQVMLFAIRGWADAAAVGRYSHHWIALGQFGSLSKKLKADGCREVVLIGSLVRPSIRQIKLDWTTLRLLPRIIRMFRGGDDHLISGVARIFAEFDLHLVGAHEVAPEIVVPEGALGRRQPTESDQADIARGFAVLSALGPFDVGQAVVVAQGRVLAIEAADGTDLMLSRIAELRHAGRIATPPGSGVLVKAPKPGQDRRFDLPSLGPRTVEAVARAGLAGLAVTAGETVIAEPAEVAAVADREKIFVLGLAASGP